MSLAIDELTGLRNIIAEEATEFAKLREAFVAAPGPLPMRFCPFGCGQLLFALDVRGHVQMHMECARRQVSGVEKAARETLQQRLLSESEAELTSMLAAFQEKRMQIFEKKKTRLERRAQRAAERAAHANNDPQKRVRLDASPSPRRAATPPPATHAASPPAARFFVNGEDEDEDDDDGAAAAEDIDGDGLCAAVAVRELLKAAGLVVSTREVVARSRVVCGVPESPINILCDVRHSGLPLPPIVAVGASTNPDGSAWLGFNDAGVQHLIVESWAPPSSLVAVLQRNQIHLTPIGAIVDVQPGEQVGHFAWLPFEQAAKYKTIAAVLYHQMGLVAGQPQPEALTEWVKCERGRLMSGHLIVRRTGCGRSATICGCGARCDPGEEECPLCLLSTIRPGRPATDSDSGRSATDSDSESNASEQPLFPSSANEEILGRFATTATKSAKPGARCPVASCGYAPTKRIGPELARHANTIHTAEQRRAALPQALEDAGLTRCELCAAFLPAPAAARSVHICGAFVPRAAAIARRRQEFCGNVAPPQQPPPAPTPPIQHSTAWMDNLTDGVAHPAPHSPPPRVAAPVAVAAQGDIAGTELPTTADLAFFSEKPRTLRSLHRRQWREWKTSVSSVLLGYTAAAREDRYRRQLQMTELPRRILRRPDPPTHQQQQPQRPDDERRSARVENLVRLGAIGKAARILGAPSLVPAELTQENIAALQALHPPEPPSTIPIPKPRHFPALAVTPRDVHRAVKKRMARAAAPGLDGWTRELFLPVVEDATLLQELTALVADMLTAAISPSFAWRVRATAGIALPKAGGKVRPIEPESAMAKLASATALQLVPASYLSSLRPLQQGVGGDVEMTARCLMQEMDASEAAVLLDGTNAYGSIHRSKILHEVFSCPELAAVHGLTSWLLAPSASVGFYANGKLAATIESSRGVRQGMLLGPLYFAVGLHRTAMQLQERFPQVQFTLYLDDITLTGTAAAVAAALEPTVAAVGDVGVTINESKSIAFFRGLPPENWKIPLASGVLRVLGAGYATGANDDVTAWVLKEAKTSADFFAALRQLPLSKMAALRLLRGSGIPRMNFLLRTHAPEKTATATLWFDGEVRTTLRHLVGMTLDDTAMEVAQLPARLGGLGLRSTAETAPLAFSSVGAKGRQRELQAEVDNARRARLQLAPRDMAWLNSASSANRPLYQEECLLGDSAFTAWVRQRLFLRVLPPQCRCTCGEDASNTHVLVCPRLAGGPRIFRHDAVVDTLAAAITEVAAGTTRVEPPSGQANRSRPDIMHCASVGRFATDVTVATPGTVTVMSTTALAAAAAAGKKKSDLWGNWALTRGIDFAPFVLEATGAAPKEGAAWLRRIFRHCSGGTQDAVEFVMGRCVHALLHGQLALFTAAAGTQALG